MYPYFQKHTDIPLHAAESPADPVRSFLSENTAFGTLLFQVTGGQGAFPIPDATVQVTEKLNDRLSLSFLLTTDESGKTVPLSLPAPDRSRSLSPNQGDAYAAYEAVITAKNHIPVFIRNLPVFDGITTIQPVSLSPDFGQPPDAADEITDKEPDL